MNSNSTYDSRESRRAFHRGMLMALGIVFVPIAFVSAGLFLSGYGAADINTGVRVTLLLAWLAYIYLADRVAELQLWKRTPVLRWANAGELVTLVAFSALLSSFKLNPGMARADMAISWLTSFAIFVLCFGMLYVLFKAFNIARQRARHRRKMARLAQQAARYRTGSSGKA